MIYFFYGDEEFNISKEISKLKSGLDTNFLEMSFKTYDTPKYPDLISILSSQPMMFGKMLIVINCFSYFTSGKSDDDGNLDGFDDNQLKQIQQALDSCNENLDIVFVAQNSPNGKKKIDKRKKIFKLLSKYNSKEFPQIPSYKTAELEAWIRDNAKSKKLNITSDGITSLLIQVGANLRMLDSELEKLKVYSNEKPVNAGIVKEICVNNEDLFAFIDYICTGQKAEALKEYQKLLMTKYPLVILSTLHKMLHEKIQIKAFASKLSPDEISKIVNIHPYRVKLEIQKLKNIPLKSLVKLKKNLTESEYKIKSGQSNLGAEKEVEYAILR